MSFCERLREVFELNASVRGLPAEAPFLRRESDMLKGRLGKG